MKKYQSVRRPIVITTAILFHLLLIFHLLFSPVIIVAASFQGIINASFVVYMLLFLSSLFFGRAYCSWFCPGCGIQEVISLAIRKKSPNSKALYLKYIISVVWLGCIVTGYILNGIHSIDLAYGMSDISVTRKIVLTIGAIMIILPLTLVFGKFASCKYVCWQAPFLIAATKIRDYFHFKGLRLKIKEGKCTGCRLCVATCPMSLDVMKHVQSGQLKHDECILCGNCIDSCKNEVIKFSFSK
jgi:ferredoxin-type protein NapH